MKRVLTSLTICLLSCGQAMAGSVAGTGGSTEYTQLENQIQLINQYEQSVQAYVRQGLQLQNELKNLVANPASLLGKDIGNLINGVGKLWTGANSIGSNVAQIDKNFATTFKSPTAKTLSQNFLRWHQTNTDTLEAALKSAGLHREQFQSDTDALTELYNESQASGGNLQALQSLSKISAFQVQQLQKLQDLMSVQNIAATTYMATQDARQAESKRALDQLGTPYRPDIPPIEQKAAPKWSQMFK